MKYLFVSGFGWSGSSALIDLLREYTSINVFEEEFRLIRDPHGIEDLRYHLIDAWTDVQVDQAVYEFIRYMHFLYRDPVYVCGKMVRFGEGYRTLIGEQYIDSVKTFIKRIIKKRYSGSWWGKYYRMTDFEFVIHKFVDRFRDPKDYMYYSSVEACEFDKAAREFIDQIFVEKYGDNNTTVVLDNAIEATNLNPLRYFPDARVVFVDRDVKDICASFIKNNFFVGKVIKDSRDFSLFLDIERKYRSSIDDLKNNPNILYIRFEDLVLDYNTTKNRIENFFQLDSADHIKQRMFFDPDVSIRNIGKYKEYLSPKECELIDRALLQ